MKKYFHTIHIAAASGMLVCSFLFSSLSAVPVYAEALPVLQGTISASHITEEGAIVTAYPIVRGKYETVKDEDSQEIQRLVEYEKVDPLNMPLGDIQHPTAEELVTIADYIRKAGESGPQGITMNDSDRDGTYTANADPGEYIILVSGSGKVIYNPAVASVNVKDVNTVSTANPESKATDFSDYFTADSHVYLKSSGTGFTKMVSTSKKKDQKGVTAAVGDTLTFTLKDMKIPSYSTDYENVVYEITDSLEAGKFSGIRELTVKVGGEPVDSSAGKTYKSDGSLLAGGEGGTYILTPGAGNTEDNLGTGFTINFSDKFIRDHGGQTVDITYESSLTEDADNNFAENGNHAELKYSNNPNVSTSCELLISNTYQYTFGIGANIDAEADSKEQEETHEINKVTAEGEEEDYVVKKLEGHTNGATKTKASKSPLAGASFSLYTTSEMTGDGFKTAVSDENGHVSFEGLDARTYYLKETQAPAGYTLNQQRYSITIEPTLDPETGVLKSYNVITKILGEGGEPDKDAGSASYSCTPDINEADGTVTNSDYHLVTNPAEVLNTDIPKLPSTGGNGIYGFILAAAAMSGGLVVWEVISRKKGMKF